MKVFRFLLVVTLALLAFDTRADERILDYQSDIRVETDGAMLVTETITVQAEGNQIKRGIYRDFPTTYRTQLGHHYVVDFDFLGVERDGQTEDWHSEGRSNGIRIYVGNKDRYVDRGEHRYVLRYRTSRQLGFFKDHDELYWNVTGNGWGFPIDQSSAEIHLPESVPASQLKAFGYTGRQDSREAALESEVLDGGARYHATRRLSGGEGLSVVLEFPKGLIAEPTAEQKLRWLLADNANLLVGLAGFLVLLGYYGWMWVRYGRDPEAGVRMPQYEPPKGFSPASLRFVRRMGYDKTCFAAALLGLAAKGWLTIEQDDKKKVTLTPTGNRVDHFAPGEKALTAKLFGGSTAPVKLEQKIHQTVQAAIAAHKASLAADYEKKYFFTNTGKWVVGLLIGVVTLVGSLLFIEGDQKFAAIFLCFWLSIWSIGVTALVSAAIKASKTANGVGGTIGALFLWFFSLPFLVGELGGLIALAFIAGFGFVLLFGLIIGTVVAFYQWMKAPTQDGARLLDKIEGFRWYLGVAEKQELDSRYHVKARPELFSEYLPYALALDVEQAWAQRFADSLTPAEMEQARPTWYHGSSTFNAASLTAVTSGISSGISSAVSSSSSSPGSSSGSSGGSGGGGGGGGGGGW